MDTRWTFHICSTIGIIYFYITVLVISVIIHGEAMAEYVSIVEETISIDSLPEELTLEIRQQAKTSHVRFHKSSSVSVNVPVFVICDNGTRLCPENPDPIPNFAMYYDLVSGSEISVKTEIIGNGTVKHYEGNIHIADEKYVLKSDDGHPASSYRYHLDRAIELQTNPVDVLKEGIVPDLPLKSDKPFLKAEHPFLSNHRRRKRQTSVYGVEVLVVIDYKIFQTWICDTEPYQDSEMQIHVGLAGYVIAETAAASSWAVASTYTQTDENGRYLFEAQKMLSGFNRWMKGLDGLPAHDHAVLFTGYNLYTASLGERVDSVTGLAFLGRICSSSSVSVVEDHGGFGSTQIAAHELGHSLGASHDGDRNSCPANGQYIMAMKSQSSSGTNRFNQWRFSSCSIKDIKDKLFRLDRSSGRCLSNPARPVNVGEWNQFIATHPGQLYTIDDICRQRLGSRSYICRDLVATSSSVCTAMWCHIPGTNQCRQFTAPRGTSCGNYQWCIDGECVLDAAAPCKADSCTFGDQPGIVFDGQTCAELIVSTPWACYNDVLQRKCCSRCRTIYIGITGCEYGNRQTTCPGFYCNDMSSRRELILKQCCKTCYLGNTPRPIPQSDCESNSIKRQTSQPLCIDLDNECRFRIMSNPSLCSSDAEERGTCCRSCYEQDANRLPDIAPEADVIEEVYVKTTDNPTTSSTRMADSDCEDDGQCEAKQLSTYADCSTSRIKEMCCSTCTKLRDQASSVSSSYVYSKLFTLDTPTVILLLYITICRLNL